MFKLNFMAECFLVVTNIFGIFWDDCKAKYSCSSNSTNVDNFFLNCLFRTILLCIKPVLVN